MKAWHALGGSTLLVLFCAGAMAQEDPEAVYAKLHRATLAGKTDEVLSYGTAAQRADLANKSGAEKDAVIGLMAQMMPKTYTITEKAIAPDGGSAILRGTGVSEFIAKSDSYLTANFKKEGGVWKVDKWSWSNNKPPPAAAKPAAVAAPKAVVPATSSVAQAAMARTEAATTPKRRSRAHEDARVCLRQPTDRAVMACAEKYR